MKSCVSNISGLACRHALTITQELMRDTTDKEQEEEKWLKGRAGRRKTVANLTRAQTMQKTREKQTEDLEKRFRNRFRSISKESSFVKFCC